MKNIELPIYGIRLELNTNGAGTITSDPMYETCAGCGQPSCLYQCDASHIKEDSHQNGFDELESEEEVGGRLAFNGAVDGIMSVVLAHACAGIDIESPAYLEGIETAIQASAANL